MIRLPSIAVAASALLAFASGCSSSSSSGGGGGVVERVVFSDNTKVHLASFDGTHLTTIATAQIPQLGVDPGQTIFGMMKHPKQPWLYVSSLIDCATSAADCWGNARIDRFVIGQNSITWAALAFDYTDTSLYSTNGARLAACTLQNSGAAVGQCAPVNGTFSADGTRLYMKDDSDDQLQIFKVAADGTLTMVYAGQDGEVYLHGIAVDPTGVSTYVYNGSTVFGVAGDEGQTVTTGNGGNTTRYLPMPGNDLLLSTDDVNRVSMYSLANVADPQLVASVVVSSNQARAVALNDAQNRVVVVGLNSIKTFGWTGTAFTPEASFDPHVGSTTLQNRNVALMSGGSRAAVAYFISDSGSANGASGGVEVFGIDPTGAITTIQNVRLPGVSRVVESLKL